MARYRIETSDKQDHMLALRGLDWALAFYDYDQWLRAQIKYNGDDLSGEQLVALDKARDKIYDILQEDNLSFDMIG